MRAVEFATPQKRRAALRQVFVETWLRWLVTLGLMNIPALHLGFPVPLHCRRFVSNRKLCPTASRHWSRPSGGQLQSLA